MAKKERTDAGWPEGVVTVDQQIQHCQNILRGYPQDCLQRLRIQEQIAGLQEKFINKKKENIDG